MDAVVQKDKTKFKNLILKISFFSLYLIMAFLWTLFKLAAFPTYLSQNVKTFTAI